MEENKNDKKLTDDDLKDRAADIEIFYKKWGKDAIEVFIEKEREYMGDEVRSLEELYQCRGTIKGLKAFKEWMENKAIQSLSRHDKEEEETPLGRELE